MINDDGVDTQLPEEGSGLYGNIKDRLSSFYHGIRLDWPPKDRSMLKQYGAFTITHITLGRAPIHDMIDKAMQVLSLGRWDDLKKQYNYDRMYHLFMLVQLSNGSLLRVEKNAVVSISNNYRIESDAEFFPVQMHEGGIVLSTFFNINSFTNLSIVYLSVSHLSFTYFGISSKGERTKPTYIFFNFILFK